MEDLTGVLHSYSTVLIGEGQKLLVACHGAELERVERWLWVDIPGRQVWGDGAEPLLPTAGHWGEEDSVLKVAGQSLLMAELLAV